MSDLKERLFDAFLPLLETAGIEGHYGSDHFPLHERGNCPRCRLAQRLAITATSVRVRGECPLHGAGFGCTEQSDGWVHSGLAHDLVEGER